MNRYAQYKELEYAIAANHRNNGYATEALMAMLEYMFSERDTEVVAAWVRSFNKECVRVLEKCHFTYEGTLRKHARDRGDTLCYSVLKEEWIEHRLKMKSWVQHILQCNNCRRSSTPTAANDKISFSCCLDIFGRQFGNQIAWRKPPIFRGFSSFLHRFWICGVAVGAAIWGILELASAGPIFCTHSGLSDKSAKMEKLVQGFNSKNTAWFSWCLVQNVCEH